MLLMTTLEHEVFMQYDEIDCILYMDEQIDKFRPAKWFECPKKSNAGFNVINFGSMCKSQA